MEMAPRRRGNGILVFALIVAVIDGLAYGGKWLPDNAAGGGIGIAIAAFIAVMLGLLPAYIAGRRGHQNYLAILMLNLLLGWTVIGWIIAMVWACTEVRARNLTPTET
jgi:ABC-type transport system involved in cytochrome c biogenesis permease component